jgi:hypothetical protein
MNKTVSRYEMNKAFVFVAVLAAAALTGIFSTNTLAAYASTDGGDESETNTEQEIKQKNVGSGESTNTNCAQNSIDSLEVVGVTCLVTEVLP